MVIALHALLYVSYNVVSIFTSHPQGPEGIQKQLELVCYSASVQWEYGTLHQCSGSMVLCISAVGVCYSASVQWEYGIYTSHGAWNELVCIFRSCQPIAQVLNM